MKKYIPHFSALLVVILLFPGCKALKELRALSKCEYRIQSVNNTSLAGIMIQDLRRFSDLKLNDAATVVKAYTSGNLPLEFTLNVQAKNPNKQKAAMTKMDWIAMIDETEILQGLMTERVEIEPNGGITDIPMKIGVNLRDILKKKSKDEMVDFGFGLADGQKKPVRVAMKLKPYIMIGKKELVYPGFITVKREFTGV